MRQFLPDPFHFAPPVAHRTMPGLRSLDTAAIGTGSGCLWQPAFRALLVVLLLLGSIALLGRAHQAEPQALTHEAVGG